MGSEQQQKVTLAVKVTPRAGADSICGWQSGEKRELVVKVTAPPADGKANSAVVNLIAKALGVPKGAVEVLRGQSSRHKMLQIDISDSKYNDWVRSIQDL